MSTDSNRRSVAIHEAAHAVAFHRAGFDPYRVTIVPDHDRGTEGTASQLDGPRLFRNAAGELCQDLVDSRALIVSLLAGLAANLEDGEPEDRAAIGAGSDVEDARHYLQRWGLEWSFEDAMRAAHESVRKEWPVIEAVAAELLERETLDDTEVELVILIADGDADAVAALAGYRDSIERFRESRRT